MQMIDFITQSDWAFSEERVNIDQSDYCRTEHL